MKGVKLTTGHTKSCGCLKQAIDNINVREEKEKEVVVEKELMPALNKIERFEQREKEYEEKKKNKKKQRVVPLKRNTEKSKQG